MGNLGAAYGTAKSGVGLSSVGIMKPDAIMKCLLPVIMAGVLGIYGLIVAVIMVQKVKNKNYYFNQGFAQFSAGCCCGFSSMVAGFCIGEVGDAGVKATVKKAEVFVGMILILIFAEAIALYGMILAIIMG